MIEYFLDPELYGEETVGNARDHDKLMTQLNYLIEEGFIEVEEDSEGQLRLYATQG